MLKIYVTFVFTLTIIFAAFAAKEDDIENRAQIAYSVFGGSNAPQTYYFGYDSKAKDAPRLMREETRLPDGTVTGRYGYTDPFGVFRVVKYVSGNNGYYATEEIGEHVTSTTPQYFKATAPQVESVSEQPISYPIDLATKFNPPLYHPEAHTMAPEEERLSSDQSNTERTGTEQYWSNSGVDNNDKNHQIFSLSNSEDILEKKYRERKQLERHLKETQTQRPVNVVIKQVISKRVGLTPVSNYEQPVPAQNDYNKNNKPINDFNNENKQNIKPFIRQNVGIDENEFFRREPTVPRILNSTRRTPIDWLGREDQSLKNIKESDFKNETEEVITETPVLITSSEAYSPLTDLTTEPVPSNLRHLYYSPTRTPGVVVKQFTPIPRDVNENKSEPKSEERDDIWLKISELFKTGSPTSTESVPKTTTDIPFYTTKSEDILRNSDNKTDFNFPILNKTDLRPIEPFSDQADRLDEHGYFKIDHLVNINEPEESILPETDIKANKESDDLIYDLTLFKVEANHNYSDIKTEDIVNTNAPDHFPIFEEIHDRPVDPLTTRVETTTVSEGPNSEPIFNEFFTESVRITPKTGENQKNLSSDLTKSGFFHDFLLEPVKDKYLEDKPITEQPFVVINVTLNSQTTTKNAIENQNLIKTTETSAEKTTESPVHPSNGRFLEDFWKSFNEQSVLFAEAQVNNQTNAEIKTNPVINETEHWISEQLDRKAIMFSEGKVESGSTPPAIEILTTTTETPVFKTKTTEKLMQTYETISEIQATSDIQTTTAQTSEMTAKTQSSTETPSTTTSTTITTQKITTTDVVNKEFLDNFWHDFNDNSDEYFDGVFEKLANNQTNSTSDLSSNVTSVELPLNRTTDKNVTEMDDLLPSSERLDLDQSENNVTNAEERVLPSVQSSDQNQNMPPLSALFEFPHMRKRKFRRVQRLRNLQTIRPEELTTTTIAPEVETDIMATEASEELTEISGSDDDSSNLRTISSQRVYRYVPPYPVFKQTFIVKQMKSRNAIPVHYSEAFDDMSQIMTTIQSMRKSKRPQTEERDQNSSTEKVVVFDDKPDSFVQLIPQKTRSFDEIRSQTKYFLPIEPQIETQSERQYPEVMEINRNINKLRAVQRYQPIIKLDA